MDFSTYRSIRLSRDGKVLNAIFNRPDTLNAFDDELEREFIRLIQEVSGDHETNVLVISGEGRAFSAGGDLKGMQAMIDNPSILYDIVPRAKRVVFELLDCPKPVIAKITGHAIGLGATVALFCDITFIVPKARIADTHVLVGLVAGDGGSVIWPQLIGYNKAKEYLFTGDALLGEDAAKLGLVNHCVAAEEIDQRVNELAQRIANGAARSIQWTKHCINIGLKQQAHSIMDASLAYEVASNATRDHQEAINALLEKRRPQFTGN